MFPPLARRSLYASASIPLPSDRLFRFRPCPLLDQRSGSSSTFAFSFKHDPPRISGALPRRRPIYSSPDFEPRASWLSGHLARNISLIGKAPSILFFPYPILNVDLLSLTAAAFGQQIVMRHSFIILLRCFMEAFFFSPGPLMPRIPRGVIFWLFSRTFFLPTGFCLGLTFTAPAWQGRQEEGVHPGPPHWLIPLKDPRFPRFFE